MSRPVGAAAKSGVQCRGASACARCWQQSHDALAALTSRTMRGRPQGQSPSAHNVAEHGAVRLNLIRPERLRCAAVLLPSPLRHDPGTPTISDRPPFRRPPSTSLRAAHRGCARRADHHQESVKPSPASRLIDYSPPVSPQGKHL